MERSVSVKLRAEISQFKSGMDQAARAALQVGEAAVRGNQKAARGLAEQQRNARTSAEAWDKVRNASTVAGAGMVAGFALVTRASMNFEQQISRVKAATHATASEMDKLKQAALDAGARTQFSASEAAQGIEELAKAGQSTTDIIGGGLDGALDLAATGSLDVGTAAEIAATTMTQFNLKGSDMAHVADLLAAGAGKAQGDVQDLALALGYVGTTASQMGVSVEETTGALAMLAANGQLGEKAGTGLRGVLMSLTAPSQQATKTMDKYGISLYDAQGKFVGLAGMADQLQTALGPLDEKTRNAALGQIFGNAQIETARILYKGGAAAVDEWTRKVDDQGYAAETAAIKMDNLAGDLETLGGAFETLMISSGEGSGGGLRFFVQTATSLLDVLADLPGPLQTTVVGVMGLGGAALLLAPRILAVKEVLSGLRLARVGSTVATTADTAAVNANTVALNSNSAAALRNASTLNKGKLGPTSALPAAGAAGMGAFATSATAAAGALAAVGSAFATYKITEKFGTLSGILSSTVFSAGGPLNALAIYMGHTSKEAAEADAKLKGVSSVLSRMVAKNDPQQLASAFTSLQAELGEDKFTEFIDGAAPEIQEAFRSIEDASKDLEPALQKASDGFEFGSVHAMKYAKELVAAGRAAGLSENAIKGLLQTAGASRGQIKIAMSADPTKIQKDIASAQRSLDGLKQYKRPDIVAETGRLQDQLDKAQRRLNSLKQAKKPDIDAINRVQARVKKIQSQIDGVKQRGKPPVDVDTSQAHQAVSAIQSAINSIQGRSVYVGVTGPGAGGGKGGGGGGGGSWAQGGHIRGAGTSTSDSILSWLSDNEFVQPASAVDYYGVDFMEKIRKRELPRFASGGVVRIRNQKKFDAANRRWQDYQEAIKARNQRSAQTKASFLSSAFAQFDFGAYESRRNDTVNAIRDEIQAQKDLADARRKALTAKGSEKASAIQEMAAAQQKYADAKKATAEATKAEAAAKPTVENITKSASDYGNRMIQMVNDADTLMAWGLPKFLISDMIGRPEGPDMMRALVSAGRGKLSALTSTAAKVNAAAARLAQIDIAVSSPDPGGATYTQIVTQKQKAQPKKPVLVKKKVKKRALGGPVSQGDPFLVGEQGPELFWPGATGHMVSAAQTHTMLGGGGPVVIRVEQPVNFKLDNRTVWEGLMDMVVKSGTGIRGGSVFVGIR